MSNNPDINNIVRDIFIMSTLKVGKEGVLHHILAHFKKTNVPLMCNNLHINNIVRDSFVMLSRNFDQVGRAGAFRILGRQMCMTDSSLYLMDDYRDKLNIFLCGDGVLERNWSLYVC